MSIKGTDRLKKWLRRALWFVPVAYGINFIYALYSDQSGGTFGDTFGAANALFSGTALLMLVLAVILQREELEVVREERNDTRKLLEGQEELTELQKTALEKQIFEQTFSSTLNSALNEKARLSHKPIINDKQKQSDYFNSAFFANRLLEMIGTEENPFGSQNSGEVKLASKNYVFINLLVHLADLTESKCPDPKDQPSQRELIRSLVDEEVAHCAAWYIALMGNDGNIESKFKSFASTYNLGKYLSDDIRKWYDTVISSATA